MAIRGRDRKQGFGRHAYFEIERTHSKHVARWQYHDFVQAAGGSHFDRSLGSGDVVGGKFCFHVACSPSYHSRFQICARILSCSKINSHALNASARWGEETPIRTLVSPTGTLPSRWRAAHRMMDGQLFRASANISTRVLIASVEYASYSSRTTLRPDDRRNQKAAPREKSCAMHRLHLGTYLGYCRRIWPRPQPDRSL